MDLNQCNKRYSYNCFKGGVFLFVYLAMGYGIALTVFFITTLIRLVIDAVRAKKEERKIKRATLTSFITSCVLIGITIGILILGAILIGIALTAM